MNQEKQETKKDLKHNFSLKDWILVLFVLCSLIFEKDPLGSLLEKFFLAFLLVSVIMLFNYLLKTFPKIANVKWLTLVKILAFTFLVLSIVYWIFDEWAAKITSAIFWFLFSFVLFARLSKTFPRIAIVEIANSEWFAWLTPLLVLVISAFLFGGFYSFLSSFQCSTSQQTQQQTISSNSFASNQRQTPSSNSFSYFRTKQQIIYHFNRFSYWQNSHEILYRSEGYPSFLAQPYYVQRHGIFSKRLVAELVGIPANQLVNDCSLNQDEWKRMGYYYERAYQIKERAPEYFIQVYKKLLSEVESLASMSQNSDPMRDLCGFHVGMCMWESYLISTGDFSTASGYGGTTYEFVPKPNRSPLTFNSKGHCGATKNAVILWISPYDYEIQIVR